MRWSGATFVSLATVMLMSCGDSPQWQGTIEERDGVVYVSNPGEGLWQDRDPAPIRFELEQVFGVDTEPEEEIIGSIGLRGVLNTMAGLGMPDSYRVA